VKYAHMKVKVGTVLSVAVLLVAIYRNDPVLYLAWYVLAIFWGPSLFWVLGADSRIARVLSLVLAVYFLAMSPMFWSRPWSGGYPVYMVHSVVWALGAAFWRMLGAGATGSGWVGIAASLASMVAAQLVCGLRGGMSVLLLGQALLLLWSVVKNSGFREALGKVHADGRVEG
jgi:hypothetical protein